MCEQVDSAVRPLLDAYFPPLSGVQVLAQPGSFYVASAFTLAASVIGKKVLTFQWDSLAQGDLCSLNGCLCPNAVNSDLNVFNEQILYFAS